MNATLKMEWFGGQKQTIFQSLFCFHIEKKTSMFCKRYLAKLNLYSLETRLFLSLNDILPFIFLCEGHRRLKASSGD